MHISKNNLYFANGMVMELNTCMYANGAIKYAYIYIFNKTKKSGFWNVRGQMKSHITIQ